MKTTIKSIAVALAFCAAAFLTVSAIIESTAPDGSEKYIMRDYNGRIAVFVYGEAPRRSRARLQRNNGRGRRSTSKADRRFYRVAKTKAAVIITQALSLMMNSRILFLLPIFIRPYQTYH